MLLWWSFGDQYSVNNVNVCIYTGHQLNQANGITLASQRCKLGKRSATVGNELHPPLSHLTKHQKDVYYAGIRIFNHLPTSIKSIANELKKTLKRFLLDNSFYSMDEFFNYKE